MRRREWLRFRVGAWLLRPYLNGLFAHYEQRALELKLEDRGRADRCTGIAIGLRYASLPNVRNYDLGQYALAKRRVRR